MKPTDRPSTNKPFLGAGDKQKSIKKRQTKNTGETPQDLQGFGENGLQGCSWENMFLDFGQMRLHLSASGLGDNPKLRKSHSSRGQKRVCQIRGHWISPQNRLINLLVSIEALAFGGSLKRETAGKPASARFAKGSDTQRTSSHRTPPG